MAAVTIRAAEADLAELIEPARALLRVIDQEPEAARRALGG